MKRKILHVFGWVAIIGNLVLIGLTAFWLLYPYQTNFVKQPIEILNDGYGPNKIKIGDNIVMKLEVNKASNYHPYSQRFINCTDGNLVTMTKSTVQAPAGKYVQIVDSMVLPPKVAVGATCKVQFVNTYKLNPIREKTVTWESEYFNVLPKE